MIGWKWPESHRNAPRSDATPTSGPESHRERAAEALWCVQWPDGRDWRETETEAEALADWLVKSGAAGVVAVFEVLVESEGDAA